MLALTNIKKSFGQNEVVKGITLNIEKGEAFGLLGPNGAGKSTTISMICGLVPYQDGDILVDGVSVKKEPQLIKKKIGVVPQDIALYPTMSAIDNLIFWGQMYGLKSKEAKNRAKEVLEIVGLLDRAKDKIETFSGGMKRRINIGAALLHKPELLIMDEPTVGIDPQSRNHILETVKSLNEQGMTIIYTSHYMEEVEFLCKRIAIIDYGQLIASGSKKELTNRLSGGKVLHLVADQVKPAFLMGLKSMDGVENVTVQQESDIDVFLQNHKEPLADIVLLANQSGVKLQQIQLQEPNLETLFLQLTGRSLRD
ncbi:ABC transporter ATP-binding protein [Bacillus sp. DTU_2020_1000418_1_SI_GHA_SEK_038]|uniref:ABC transporter ATP-binding protein n=1 Tax=Bacillus sp. DTU_2020_1000418_1_SI_GHA_SEK_038 TaxID=3077585 RepID=UPI0028E27B2F|nr:ABC transporter ATP-binding protein [Bacillus sp. DTU_2020_1000418_1_SI_GHA_SEK_038]WNS76271.1 ABC transporter ATP-binding protein [Bacillus sp. DTU_2020_1000418_1_SI_GHA_SEK_038]